MNTDGADLARDEQALRRLLRSADGVETDPEAAERRTLRFAHSLRQLRDDPQEAARIDEIIDRADIFDLPVR